MAKICLWKEILEANLNGKGTSLLDRKPEKLSCYQCNGSIKMGKNLGCNKYAPSEKEFEHERRAYEVADDACDDPYSSDARNVKLPHVEEDFY